MTRPTSTMSPCFSSVTYTQAKNSSVLKRDHFLLRCERAALKKKPGRQPERRSYCTFTNEVEGNVEKSDATRAPGCWLTTCSATSP